jgi:deoxyribodipyrimidine photo-lyase
MENITIFWFRRDLRLNDNVGLYQALQEKGNVLPIFIFDTEILDKLPKDDARVNFIHDRLSLMNEELKSHGAGLSIYNGKPLEVYKSLIEKYTISAVYTNRDYEPYATSRDQEIGEFLAANNIEFKTFKDQVIFETNEVTKADGNPYVVYTPYSRKWLEHYTTPELSPSEDVLDRCVQNDSFPFLTLADIGFEPTQIPVPNFIVNPKLIQEYEETRNFPALDQTSRLGPHLRFGSVSVRQMVIQAKKEDNPTFLKELIWREFFMQILWHFPHTKDQSFKSKYDRIVWRNNEDDFKKWCEGNTGFPLVDAGMRQLNQTGFMHNRVRMLVGSFLCKHLLIDWRWGEAYFAEKLHDYEMASNVGNWQWVAGSGVDAAPYFRIFNPTSQIQKFDKQLAYIKKWVPDFQELTYPQPMVDHKFARERCLTTYKEALA